MVDVPQKTRHAVQMACAARALARAAPSDHLKRVLARYVFVHLHDVMKFAPAWRNQLLRDERTALTAQAATPALERLRRDWGDYEDVRHFIGAKRQARDPTDTAADQLETFELWSRIGLLSVEALVDDAVELYVQLAALTGLDPIDPEPELPEAVLEGLADFEPVGEEAYLEVNASSFSTGRADTASVRMGGKVGVLTCLVNDVAESASLLSCVAAVPGLPPSMRTLVTCELMSEMCEILRLTIGPPSGQVHDHEDVSLLAHYKSTGRHAEVCAALEHLAGTIPAETRENLLAWRNQLGAHTDTNAPWEELLGAIEGLQLDDPIRLLEWIEMNLENAACTPGGPILLLLGTRQFKSIFSSPGYGPGLSYDDVETDEDPGSLQSALPPDYADSEYVIWVGGPQGSMASAGVAGMLSGRAKRVQERFDQWQKDRAAREGRS